MMIDINLCPFCQNAYNIYCDTCKVEIYHSTSGMAVYPVYFSGENFDFAFYPERSEIIIYPEIFNRDKTLIFPAEIKTAEQFHALLPRIRGMLVWQ